MSALAEKLSPDLNDNIRAARRPDGSGNDPAALEERSVAEMRDWSPILAHIGTDMARIEAVAERASTNETSFQSELLAADLCAEDDLYRPLAHELGLSFTTDIDPARLIVDDDDFPGCLGPDGERKPISYAEAGRAPFRLIGSGPVDIARLRAFLAREPRLAGRLLVVPPKVLRAAVIARAAEELGAFARDGLAEMAPDCSARVVTNAWQRMVIGAIVMALPIGFALWPSGTMLVLHAFFSLFFLACVVLRMRAARHAEPPVLRKLEPVAARDLPTYSIMIALYREADVVPELLVSLGRLVWPRSKLEIKLVCEADDVETIAAIRAHDLKPWIEIVEVPSIGPRTKPKALAFALPMTTGEFVAIYDAEDKPHPLQLVEAWQTFARADALLACLQAPLVITNTSESLVSRLFGFEYAALFRGILPWLSSKGLILPLGGTSNHFRRKALVACGGWDPYNVTEDADLGLRLVRFGYRCGTISYPTFEDAPTSIATWIPQRTRWFKGWLQTWLVHMRQPLRLWREIGTGSFLIVQVLFAGMVLSAIAHPLMLATIAAIVWEVTSDVPIDSRSSLLFAIDMVNITCGYAAFLALGVATLMTRERRGVWKVFAATPAYWMLISWAAWRAVWHLYRKPFLWEKTPHRKSSSIWARNAVS